METVASGQTFTKLVEFNGPNGATPTWVSLAQGIDGYLYGTTAAGGDAPGEGTVFKISRDGRLATLHSFAGYPVEGGGPGAGLVLANDGNFYGTTSYGGKSGSCRLGCGTVYRITSAGTLTTLHSFDVLEGSTPLGRLLQATDGNLYGANSNGGDLSCNNPNGCGTLFRLASDRTLTILHTFEGPDGAHPYPGPIQASDGNLYETTWVGGANDGGTVFKITPKGLLTILNGFCTPFDCLDGHAPAAGVVQAIDGNLYGTTAFGGEWTWGTVFKVTPDGEVTTLHSFCSPSECDGEAVYPGIIQATDGNFYGMTSGGIGGWGTVFKITPQGVVTTLHSFSGVDGGVPYGGLLQATNGILYGVTSQGGTNNGGVVFSLDVGLGPFVALVRDSGKVGGTGGILGQGFTGTTAVSLNGTPASFTVVSDTYIRAAVPPVATTGYVTVSTPSGTLTSNKVFQVLPQFSDYAPHQGPVGTQVDIKGVSLSDVIAVGFGDRVPAQFTVVSDHKVLATVPEGAKTGPIGIEIKGGRVFTFGEFVVTQ